MPGDQPSKDDTKPTAEEQELMDRFAKWIVRRGLTVPAIIFFETTKPLNWIGSQAMLVAEPAAWALAPFMQAFFGMKHEDYLKFQKMMEKRHNMENLLLTIEKFDAEAKIKNDEIKLKRQAEKKMLKAQKKAEGRDFMGRFFRRGKKRPQ